MAVEDSSWLALEFWAFQRILGVEMEGVRFRTIPGRPVDILPKEQAQSLEGKDDDWGAFG